MSPYKLCHVGSATVGSGELALIAGPCVAESLDLCMSVAEHLAGVCESLGIGYVFKASYDKANRSSIDSYRGPGLAAGLKWLAAVREKIGVPVLSDVHECSHVAPAAEVLDCLQIPAFLCRQTDLLLEAGRAGKPVNIKKGQFMAPWDMKTAVEKVKSTGNDQVILTDRGTSFGYNRLITRLPRDPDHAGSSRRWSSTRRTRSRSRPARATRPAGRSSSCPRWRARRWRPGPTHCSSRRTRTRPRQSPTRPAWSRWPRWNPC